MFVSTETNNKAEAIKAWLTNHRELENQGTLSKQFKRSITFVNLSLNKKMTTKGAENLVDDIYEYLHKKYGL